MMLFDEVTIVTDERMAESALALRATLEAYRLRVTFHRLVQRRQALEVLTQLRSDWIVLMSHGRTLDDGTPSIYFSVVGNDADDSEPVEAWYPSILDLTAGNIPDIFSGVRGSVISPACGGGRRELADAFLAAGCSAYVAARETYLDTTAAVLFIASLFYFLLAEDRDLAPRAYGLSEAVERARAVDQGWQPGTEAFECFIQDRTQ